MFDPRSIWTVMGFCVAAYLAYTSLQPSIPANAERAAYLRTTVNGKTNVTKISHDECISTKQRLWAEAGDEVECIAYITSKEQPRGDKALVFFHGDFRKDNQTAVKMRGSERGYQRRADLLAEVYKLPVYIIARPGVMGSTGFHVIGGVRAEHRVIAAAITALKQRHGIRHLALAGQSGGARLAAQLLASGRTDIQCAVMASGAYGIPHARRGGRMPTNIWGEPSHSYLIPLRNIDGVSPDPRRRVYVIGDPRDKRTPFPEQREWAEALQNAGHHAVLLTAAGGGEDHHYLSQVSLDVAGMCAADKSDQAIRQYMRNRQSPPTR